jgi:hypothetical protein
LARAADHGIGDIADTGLQRQQVLRQAPGLYLELEKSMICAAICSKPRLVVPEAGPGRSCAIRRWRGSCRSHGTVKSRRSSTASPGTAS